MREYAGHEAIFLIPNNKLGELCKNGFTTQSNIEGFLIGRHGSFHIESTDIRGFWRGASDGIYTKFVVAFVGKGKIAELEEFLEALALSIDEEGIYFKAGIKTWILRPKSGKNYPVI